MPEIEDEKEGLLHQPGASEGTSASNEQLLKKAKDDILTHYEEMLNGNDPLLAKQVFHFFIYGDFYRGKYQSRLAPWFGYDKENHDIQDFLKLVNQLALTDADWFYHFKNARNQEEEQKCLKDGFTKVQKKHFAYLEQSISEKVAVLVEKFHKQDNGLDRGKLEELIKESIKFDKNDYDSLQAKIKNLKESKELNKLTALQILEIIKLRDEVINEKQNLVADLKRIKKTINHYALSQNYNWRIQIADASSNKNSESKASIESTDSSETSSDNENQNKGSSFSLDTSSNSSSAKPGSDSTYFELPYSVDGVFSDDEKTRRDHIKKEKEKYKKIASQTGSFVGFGEGVVPAVAIAKTLAAMGLGLPVYLSLAVLTGLSGGIFNKFLVQDDTEDMLKGLLLGNMLDNMEDGYTIERVSAKPKPGDVKKGILYVYNNNRIPTAYFINKQNILVEEIIFKQNVNNEEFSDIMPSIDSDYLTENQKINIAKALDITLKNEYRQSIKRDLAIVLGSASLTTGFVYAALSAMQLIHGLIMPVLGLLKVKGMAFPLVAASTAVLPILFTGIGLASIYFFVISDFIKNERWLGIKKYFRMTFVDLGWKEMWQKDKGQVAKHVLSCLAEIIKLVLVFSIVSTVTFISFGLFHKQCVGVLSSIMTKNLTQNLATGITLVSTVITTVFNIKKIHAQLKDMTFKSLVVGALSFVGSLSHLLLFKIPFLITIAAIPVTLRILQFAAINVPTYLLQTVFAFPSYLLKQLMNVPVLIPKLMAAPVAIGALALGVAVQVVRAVCALVCYLIQGVSLGHIKLAPAINTVCNAMSHFFFSLSSRTNASVFSWEETYGKWIKPAAQKVDQGSSWITNRITDGRRCVNKIPNKLLDWVDRQATDVYTQVINNSTKTSKTVEMSVLEKNEQNSYNINTIGDVNKAMNPLQQAAYGVGKKVIDHLGDGILPNSSIQASMFSRIFSMFGALSLWETLCAYAVSSGPNVSSAEKTTKRRLFFLGSCKRQATIETSRAAEASASPLTPVVVAAS